MSRREPHDIVDVVIYHLIMGVVLVVLIIVSCVLAWVAS